MKGGKIAVIGLDSLVPNLAYRFVKEGSMPNLKKLMKRAVHGRAIPSFPTHTPTNWTTIATGADVAIHGINVFNYNTGLRRAESIWQAVERQKGFSILLRYPGTWPVDFSSGIVFDQGGNFPSIFRLAQAQVYLVGEKIEYVGGMHGTVDSMAVRFMPARDWKNMPDFTMPPLEGKILINTDDDKKRLLPLWVLLLPEKKGYKKIFISEEKNYKKPLCVLKEGEWSDFIIYSFQWKGKTRAAFRFKLILLSPDGKRMRLYRSEVYPVEKFSYPSGITEELTGAAGPYVGTPGRILLGAGWMDTFLEEGYDQVQWLSRSAAHLTHTRDWNLFMIEFHIPDFVEHKFWSLIDPESDEYNSRNAREGWDVFRNTYALADKFIAQMVNALPEETIIAVTSDHGHCIMRKSLLMENALYDAGLFKPDDPENSPVTVNYYDIWINRTVKRNSREYHKLANRVIEVLAGIKDRENGVSPIGMLLKNSEVPFLGLSPETSGDLVFSLRCGYGSHPFQKGQKKGEYTTPPYTGKWGTSGGTHGQHFPTSTYSLGEMYAFFLLAGKGVRKNVLLPYPIHLKDIIPTACYRAGIDSPKNANGAVVKEVFDYSG